MTVTDIIILITTILLIAGIIFYLIKRSRKGCAGCEYAKKCDTYCAKIEIEE